MNLRTKFTSTTLVLVLLLFVVLVAILLYTQDKSKPQHSEQVSESTRPPENVILAVDIPADITITTEVQEFEALETSDEELSVTTVNGQHVKPGVLVYSEEFNDFNTTAWNHVIGASPYHFAMGVNNRSNSFVRDGVLFLKPTFTSETFGEGYLYPGPFFHERDKPEKCGNNVSICWKNKPDLKNIFLPTMTAVITSSDSFKFRYGKLVIRAKMPGGDWTEPLVSMVADKLVYGDDEVLSGTVSITDTRGNKNYFNSTEGLNIGSERICSDISFGTSVYDREAFHACYSSKNDEGFDQGFHDYEVLWTPDLIEVKVDGVVFLKGPTPESSMFKLWAKNQEEEDAKENPWEDAENRKMAPFDQEFFLMIGLSVGGTYGNFPEDAEGLYPKPWKDSLDHEKASKEFWKNRNSWESTWAGDRSALQIEFIRFWSLNMTLNTTTKYGFLDA